MKYLNYKLKENLSDFEQTLRDQHGIVFLEDEDQNDWYESLKEIMSEGFKMTLKVSSTGDIISYSTDPTSLLAEESISLVPLEKEFNFKPDIKYRYNFKKSCIETRELNSKERLHANRKVVKNKKTELRDLIFTFKCKEDLGLLTKDEEKELLTLKNIFVKLSELSDEDLTDKNFKLPTE